MFDFKFGFDHSLLLAFGRSAPLLPKQIVSRLLPNDLKKARAFVKET